MCNLISLDNLKDYVNKHYDVLEELVEESYHDLNQLAQKSNYSMNAGEKLCSSRLKKLKPRVFSAVNNVLGISENYKVNVMSFNMQDEITLMRAYALYNCMLFSIITGDLAKSSIITGCLTFVLLADTMRRKKLCDVSYFNKGIFLEEEIRDVAAVAHLAHEYVHYIQKKYLALKENKGSPIMEGHARFIEHKVCKEFSRINDDSSYLFLPALTCHFNLTSAYLLASDAKGILPKLTILYPNLICQWDEGLLDAAYRRGYGVGAMFIAQRLNGNRVLKQIMQGDYSFFER